MATKPLAPPDHAADTPVVEEKKAKKSKNEKKEKQGGEAAASDGEAGAGAAAAAEEQPAAAAANPLALDNFALSDPVKSLLRAKGIESLFDIQARCLPPVLEGKDLVGRARTGCGKTLAFVLPIIERLAAATGGSAGAARRPYGRAPSVVVLAPTRELAKQVRPAAAPCAVPPLLLLHAQALACADQRSRGRGWPRGLPCGSRSSFRLAIALLVSLAVRNRRHGASAVHPRPPVPPPLPLHARWPPTLSTTPRPSPWAASACTAARSTRHRRASCGGGWTS